MKFEFTKKDQFDRDKEFRGGGELKITAENLIEVNSIISHFKLFKGETSEALIARAQAMQKNTMIHIIYSEKRPVYHVEGKLDSKFIEPYKKWMLNNFGYDGNLPNLKLKPKWDGLCFTHYCDQLFLDGGDIYFNAYNKSQSWNGKTAQDYATAKVHDYMGEFFGHRPFESEYIDNGRGCMKKNPNYLKRHKAQPRASNAMLKNELFNWWRINHANKKQLEVINGVEEISKGKKYMNSFDFENSSYQIHYEIIKNDKDQNTNYNSMSFEEFVKLK